MTSITPVLAPYLLQLATIDNKQINAIHKTADGGRRMDRAHSYLLYVVLYPIFTYVSTNDFSILTHVGIQIRLD
jgi:hypothetical protein